MKVGGPRSARGWRAWRARLGWLARLGVAVGGFLLALRAALPADGPGLAEALSASRQASSLATLGAFAASFGILGAGIALGALRFRSLLVGAGRAARWWPLFRAYVVASFFNLVLPGAVLGDAYRVWDVRDTAGGGSAALGLIVLERLLGLSALGAMALVAAPFLRLSSAAPWLSQVLVALGLALFAATLALLHPRSNAFLGRVMARLAAPWPIAGDTSTRVQRALHAVAALGERPAVIVRCILYSLLSQVTLVAAVFVLSLTLDSPVAWYWFFVLVPFITLVSLIPVSIGGAGVREYLYVTLFGMLGMPAPAALGLSLAVFAVSIAWGLAGLSLFLLDRRAGARTAG